MNEKPAIEWIPLTKWHEEFKYPSMGAMRNIAARRNENGANEFLSMINKRLYINVKKFHLWFEKQKV